VKETVELEEHCCMNTEIRSGITCADKPRPGVCSCRPSLRERKWKHYVPRRRGRRSSACWMKTAASLLSRDAWFRFRFEIRFPHVRGLCSPGAE
jgi:hypothetical protein